MREKLSDFLTEYYSFIEPISRNANIAYFNASISGKDSDYKKYSDYQLQISKYYSDKEIFNVLKTIKESGKITDQIQKRELQLIYNEFLSNQFDEKLNEEIIKLSTELEQKFSIFRTSLNGNEVTDNDIDKILETSLNSEELQQAWKESIRQRLICQKFSKVLKKRKAAE